MLDRSLQSRDDEPQSSVPNWEIVERLLFGRKTRKFRGKFICNGSSRWKFFSGKSNSFRGITFFPFLPKRPKFSVPFVWITSARLQVERKRKIYRYFVNGTVNPVPVFGAKKIPAIFDGNFSPKFPYKMVSARAFVSKFNLGKNRRQHSVVY